MRAGKTIRLGVLASGNGTNLEAIAAAIDAGELPAEIAIVISDRHDAFVLERARRLELANRHIDPSCFESRLHFDREVISTLNSADVDLVVLAGYMRIVGHEMVAAFRNRIMNIHPSLLPSFPGVHGVRDALEHGSKVSGVTVHFVDEGLDTGPIIIQEVVPVMEGDDEQVLHERIHQVEYKAYPHAIRLFAEGRLMIEGSRVRILPEPRDGGR